MGGTSFLHVEEVFHLFINLNVSLKVLLLVVHSSNALQLLEARRIFALPNLILLPQARSAHPFLAQIIIPQKRTPKSPYIRSFLFLIVPLEGALEEIAVQQKIPYILIKFVLGKSHLIIHLQKLMQGGTRPCKFGDSCHKNLTGSCTFYHPPGQMGNMGGNSGGMGNNRMEGGNRPCKFGENCNKNLTGSCTFYHPPNQMGGNGMGGNKGWGGNNGNSFEKPQNRPPPYQKNENMSTNQNNFKNNNSQVFSTICRQYHLNQNCQYAQTCKKKHFFILNDEHALRRFNFLRNIPTNLVSKLTKFRSGNKDYFALRNGNVINFFDFNFETKALSDVFSWPLPELPPNLKYNYYDQKGDYIYYSYPNPQTLIEDMGIFHIPTQKAIHITNSHSGRITGMAHFNQNVILTTSMAGQLKVWVLDGETYVAHTESTQRLRLNFNPMNQKIELLFLDISDVNGTKCITVGTNDGRLLFFVGNDLAYSQVLFKDQTYLKVYGIRYTVRPGNPPTPCAVVLLWNGQQTITTLMEINLNNFTQTILVQSQVSQENNKSNICYFQFVDSLLMAATISGEVNIYRYPDTKQKIGGILHQNTINDIVFCEEQLKNTGTKIKYMLILERKTDKREGSLGFYILK